MSGEETRPEKTRRRLLVTGCARSGTLYAAKVFRAAGLDIRHERPVPPDGVMGNDGMASWFMTVDDPAPPYGPSAIDYEFDYVLHIVRNPICVIPSVAQFVLRNNPRIREYMERHVPEMAQSEDDEPSTPVYRLVLKAMRYWYFWNLKAQQKANETVQVERLIDELPRLCDRLQHRCQTPIEYVPTDTNHRGEYLAEKRWVATWKDFQSANRPLSDLIRELGESYGY